MSISAGPEELLFSFFSQSENGALMTDSFDRILWINPAACRILDRAEEDVLDRKAASLGLHRNISDTALIKKQSGLEITVSTLFTTKQINGADYTLITFEEIYPGLSSKIDLFEQELLYAKNGNYDSAVNIWSVDTNFNYTFFSEPHRIAMKNVWNSSISLGKKIFDYLPDKKYRDQVEQIYKSIIDGSVHRSIDHFITVTGEEKYLENFGNPIRDKTGRITGLMLYSVDITKRKELENRLRLSVSLLESMMNSPENIHILSVDRDFNYLFFNNAHSSSMQSIWNVKPEIGGNILELLPDPDYRRIVKEFYLRSLAGEIVMAPSTITDKSGSILYFDNIASPITDNNGNITGITVYIIDVTEKQKADKKIMESLKEKEFLLREIHHRVKNNLQTISSMINLQMNMVEDNSVQRILQDSLNRISTMGIIHETLYQGETLGKINMASFSRRLIDSITAFYNAAEPAVEIITNIDNIQLSIDQAIPVGLILNELITNSMKYAFDGMKSGKISISLSSPDDNRCHLRVADNGRGLPDNLDIAASDSMGVKLVSVFTNQLKGQIDYISENGLTVNVNFNRH